MRLLNHVLLAAVMFTVLLASCAEPQKGEFDDAWLLGSPDVGGSASYDPERDTYHIRIGATSALEAATTRQLLGRRMSGDLVLGAAFDWAGADSSSAPAGWTIRADESDEGPFAEAAVTADGNALFRYRRAAGREIEMAGVAGASGSRLVLERHGSVVSYELEAPDGARRPVAAASIALPDTVLVALTLGPEASGSEAEARFSNVSLEAAPAVDPESRVVESTLEIISIETGERRIVRRAREHFEAPNWSRDGDTLIYNSEGLLYRIAVDGGEPELIDTDFANECNNDHGLSPDGSMLALSSNHEGSSLIYVVDSRGGTPRQVTDLGPSYWHGWSPDGRMLAYCASRDGEYDIYVIPVEGGEEVRLSTAEGLDDGPDYSPDGRYIFFNSVRTGQMKIWRMDVDGENQIQVTPDDEFGDWFPHPSPDNRWIVFVSYDSDVEGHPPNQSVKLRMMPLEGGTPRILAALFGGQGTINVPSWSPDSREVAFVSYRLVAP